MSDMTHGLSAPEALGQTMLCARSQPDPRWQLAALLLVLVLAVLSACSTRHPLGIPDEEWQKMSIEERLDARKRQAELDRAVEERLAAEARAREAQAQHEQMVLDARRREARYGERLQCVLSDAQAHMGGKWRAVEPLAIDIVRGMTLELTLVESPGKVLRYTRRLDVGFDGQTLSLCPNAFDAQRNTAACARVLGTFEQYRRGLVLNIDAKRFLRGRLRCDLAPGKGMPPQMLIER